MEQLLKVLGSFAPMSEPLTYHLTTILKEQSIRKNEFLLKAGQVNRNIYFIDKGLLRCYYEKDEREVSRWFMDDGEVIVSISSFYAQNPSTEYIQALRTTRLFYITHTELQLVYSKFPEFERIARMLTEKYYQLWDLQLYAVLMQSAAERYAWLMHYHPKLLLQVPAKHIASYLGISEVTLYKLKSNKDKKCKDEKTIPGQHMLDDVAGLQQKSYN